MPDAYDRANTTLQKCSSAEGTRNQRNSAAKARARMTFPLCSTTRSPAAPSMTYGWLKLRCCRKLPKMLKSAEACSKLPKDLVARTETETGAQQSARARLAALREKKAPTKAAQIRTLWPEIKAALKKGHTLKAVCDCLEADGITITVQTLGSYITRMRRKSVPVTGILSVGSKESAPRGNNPSRVTEVSDSKREKSNDPVANVRERQQKRSAFDYRPELADPKELI